LSRKSYPKQFNKLVGDATLFQESALRLTTSEAIEFAPQITLTNSDFRFIIGEQLQEAGIDPGPILIEPEAKNTAAAILAASIFAHASDEDAVLLVAPSDHLIPDKVKFHRAIAVGLPQVQSGQMVTFGIKPTHPETGYGYLKLSRTSLDHSGTARVESFVEKPNLSDAQKMFAKGRYLWNAGIFLFRARDMIDAFRVHAPTSLELVERAVGEASTDLGFLRLAPEPWSDLEDISIDYAIMEKAQNLVAVPYTSKWSDLGGWDAVWMDGDKDPSGNVTTGAAHALDCNNSLLRSESDTQQLVGIGLDEIMAIAMPDTVQTMAEGQSVYVPLGARHRLENPGALPMVLIEVQIGSYLGEDDITRYEDLYARK